MKRQSLQLNVLTSAAFEMLSTCGYSQKGSASRRQLSHSLSSHVIAAPGDQPCNHSNSLFLGYDNHVCDWGVGHNDSMEVKLSKYTVPAYRDKGSVHIAQMEGA